MDQDERAKRRAAMEELVAQADAGLPAQQPQTSSEGSGGPTGPEKTKKSKKPKKKKSFFRRLLSVISWLIIIGLVALLAGFVYQAMGEREDRAAYIAPGEKVEVNGHRMHVYSEQKAGKASDEPTVVLIAGWGTVNPYTSFSPMYPFLRDKISFAVVDRFGYGYSDLTDEKRRVDRITEELRQALIEAKVEPPYILTAHSLGSLEAIRFAQKYPDEVAGIVTIDSGSPEFYLTFPEQPTQLIRLAVKSGIVRALYHVNGFTEYLNGQRNGLRLLSPTMKEQERLATLLVSMNDNVIDEMRNMKANAQQVIDAKTRLNIPIVQLVADRFGEVSEDWLEMQRNFGKSWSTQSETVVVQNSAHSIQSYDPQAIVDEVLEMAAKSR
ncbi:alpha/beta hydrolase [Saccharibacillus sp. JS10]|uniref:alpha/beta hydrolase n=1 Tax=Saccharibacillus sp. JS10 TaxID=2950552 RepID=UPI0021089A96|nr:alpha/beta hydrolase [Saccharibacillus sp. JS10]MCQ4087980.1 alpha/beta hydrolase [Saccharibacillus sp. JS10]